MEMMMMMMIDNNYNKQRMSWQSLCKFLKLFTRFFGGLQLCKRSIGAPKEFTLASKV